MRVGNQTRPVLRELGSEIRPFISGEPERMRSNGRIGPPNHFKLQVGNKRLDRNGRVLLKIARPIAADFFAAKEHKDNGALWLRSGHERIGQFQDRGDSRSVVVSAVVNVVAW